MDKHDLTSARLKAVARLMEAIAACDHRDRAVLLCPALETLAAGAPDIPFLDLQEEAEDWACLATPYELEAYLIACADRLERTPLAAQARRRIPCSSPAMRERSSASTGSAAAYGMRAWTPRQ